LSPDEVAAFRAQWKAAHSGLLQHWPIIFEPGTKVEFLHPRRLLEYDRRPPRPPIPFCWGPCGEIILLALMLGPYVALILFLHWIGVIE
jgi:hypothetical protein